MACKLGDGTWESKVGGDLKIKRSLRGWEAPETGLGMGLGPGTLEAGPVVEPGMVGGVWSALG